MNTEGRDTTRIDFTDSPELWRNGFMCSIGVKLHRERGGANFKETRKFLKTFEGAHVDKDDTSVTDTGVLCPAFLQDFEEHDCV